MAYDTTRSRVVLFGGFGSANPGGQDTNDTWEFDGLTWTQIVPQHLPAAREQHAMAYDSTRQQVVMFSGYGQPDGATWEYSGGPAHPAFLTGETALTNGIYYLQFPGGKQFGYFSYLGTGGSTIFHFDLGYEYIIPGASNAAYLYDFKSGHVWYTTPASFPYLYDFTLRAYLYYFPDAGSAGHYTADPRYFVNLSTQQIFTM